MGERSVTPAPAVSKVVLADTALCRAMRLTMAGSVIPASHAKVYGEFFPFAVEAYADWAEDVRSGAYPEDKHGYHMEEAELEKFMDALEKF